MEVCGRIASYRGSPRTLILATAVGLLLSFTPVVGAQAASWTWHPSRVISNGETVGGDLAVAPGGEGVIIWRQFVYGRRSYTVVRAVRRTSNGRLTRFQRLTHPSYADSDSSSSSQHVAIRADGLALATWTQAGRIQAAVSPRGTPFTPPMTIGRGGSIDAALFDRRGRALIVFERDASIWLARGSTSFRFGGPRRISAAGSGAAAVALDVEGRALIVWNRTTRTQSRLESRTIGQTGRLGPIRTIATGPIFRGTDYEDNVYENPALGSPSVAADSGSRILVAWDRGDGRSPQRVELTSWTARTGFRPARTIASNAYDPQVATNGRGDAAIVWNIGEPCPECEVRMRVRPRGHSPFGPSLTIARANYHGDAYSATYSRAVATPLHAVTPGGRVIVSWVVEDEETWVRAVDGLTRLENARRLSQGGHGGFPGALAVDARGRALSVFSAGAQFQNLSEAAYGPAGGR